MVTRRLVTSTFAVWLGLFMAVLMPLHANSHCAAAHGPDSQTELTTSSDNHSLQPDLCSICKALSHLSLVYAQAGDIDLHPIPAYPRVEQTVQRPFLGYGSLSPRAPPQS